MPLPGFNPEARQDAELRAVRIPEMLLERLRWAALADDEGLDAAVRHVPTSPRLLRRLRQPALDTDEGLDAALRDVPVPAELYGRLRQVQRNWIRWARWTEWVAAASLLTVIGLSYFGAMIGFLISAYSYPGEVLPAKSISLLGAWYRGQPGQPEPDFSVAIPLSSSQPQQGPSGSLPTPVPDVELVRPDTPGRASAAGLGELFAGGGHRGGAVVGDDLFLDVGLHRWGVLTAHRPFDDLPELKLVAGLIPRGIDWPLVPGSNPHILLRFGVHPFVSPAAHLRLQSGLVPLGVDASSYELTRRYLEDGRLPPPEVVRTEEFLAAVDYGFPVASRQALGLSTAAGPSPFGGPGLWLMQIGVQAGQLPAGKRQPTYLVLAVDLSASMRWGGRLEMISRELSGLVRRLGPEDRVSLITFSEDAETLAEEAGPDEADQLSTVIKLLAPRSSTNVGAGLREAYTVAARRTSWKEAVTRVVLLTDGLAEFGAGTAEKIEQQLDDAVQRGILLDVIDLGQEREADSQWADFARSGGGRVHRASNAEQLRWALWEIVSGQSQLVAADARLKVAFNPRAVLEYRLLGHEAKAMAGLMPAHPEADFHAGQSATALYEIRLGPGGPQEVAAVELTWREPGRGKPQMASSRVRRGQFGSSFVGAPLSLQEAALVAEAAEVLRQSPYAVSFGDSPSLGLTRVLQLAGQADTRLYQRPSFVDFVVLVEQATRARPYRGR